MTFARSAPVNPGVCAARTSRSSSLPSGLPFEWTSRMSRRPLRSGRSTTIWRSKRAGAQERRVEDVRAVRGRDQDHVVLLLEAVHLDEELVQRLLALVVAAAHAGAAVAADGVDLVDEDDARARLLGLLEQVAHARGADADEHLDEVGAGDREERHARLTGRCAREERLAGAGRPVQEDALRDARAEGLELLRVLEELLDLVQLLDRLVGARDVLVGDLRRVRRHPLRAALAEAHHLGAAALHLVHEEDPEADEEQDRQEARQERNPRRGAGALRVELDVVLREDVLELDLRLRRRVVDLHLLARVERRRDRLAVRVELDLAHVPLLRLLDQLRVGELGLVVALRDQRLARQVDEQHDDDEGEQRAAEEAIHEYTGG